MSGTGELDHDPFARPRRAQKFGRPNVDNRETGIEFRRDGLHGFVQQHRAGDDGIAGKMPSRGRVIAGKRQLGSSQVLTRFSRKVGGKYLERAARQLAGRVAGQDVDKTHRARQESCVDALAQRVYQGLAGKARRHHVRH